MTVPRMTVPRMTVPRMTVPIMTVPRMTVPIDDFLTVSQMTVIGTGVNTGNSL